MEALAPPVLEDVVDLVAAWLPDKTPLAAVARFARCSAHFRSYLAAGSGTPACECFACPSAIRCRVLRHRHEDGFVVYEGDDSSYVWQPCCDRVACDACAARLGLEARRWEMVAWCRRFDDDAAEAVFDVLCDVCSLER